MSNNIRNITIIAHVDHGKTTLIDNLMKQSGSFRDNEVVDERLMDSGELEKERGITILAKPASINWNNSRINIIDTPGHRDFAAEVERVLSMADGALLLIDSAEGVMPQTKFVLSKALKQGLKPIVVINKLDKPDQRANEVLDETFDLFVSLDANEDQLDFPVLYASGRSGWASKEINGPKKNLQPLLDLIIKHVKPTKLERNAPFAMLSTLLYADNFLGRSLVGRIAQGTAKANQLIKAINLKGEKVDEGRLTKIFRYEGTKKVPIEIGEAGDIVIIAGLENANVADTICDLDVDNPLDATPIDPPTMSIKVTVNSSPLAGTEGNKLTSTQIRERLINDLGDKHCLILKNHGLLTTGATCGDAWLRLFFLERACTMQIKALSGGLKLNKVPADVIELVTQQGHMASDDGIGQLAWPGLIRKLDKIDPSYKH